MIEIKPKIHDKYSFEFKISFIINGRDQKQQDTSESNVNEYSINTWLFVPNSVDINRSTYSKEEFYKDVMTNVRLITPFYQPDNIYEGENSPFALLEKHCREVAENPQSDEVFENCCYHIRMFSCICKSSLRDKAYFIVEMEDENQIKNQVGKYISDVQGITESYRSLSALIYREGVSSKVKESFTFGDEFIGNIVEQQTFRLMRGIKKRAVFNDVKDCLVELLEQEIAYKKAKNYSVASEKSDKKNYLVIMRRGILKKLTESDLYLNTKNTEDGAFIRQFYYGIAAGIAMVFATIVAFTAQIHYGNLTTPLFLALVVSYIFKDRIKDLMRYYFSTQLGKKYYDTKRELEVRNQKIGWTKEAFDFVTEDKTPDEVLNIRKRTPLVEAENNIYNEKIILYKKLVNLPSDKFRFDEDYMFPGVNDITRFNIVNLILKMDNPYVSLYMPEDEEGYKRIMGEKVYAIYAVVRCQSKNELYYKKIRVLLNREGIKEIKEFLE